MTGTLAQALRGYCGTGDLAFDFTSTVIGSTHRYATVNELVAEVQLARVAGGMHFRSSVIDGDALGARVANWALAQKFLPR